MKVQFISEMDKDRPYYESSRTLSHDIAKVIENRFRSSKLLNSDGTLLIYLFFNYDVKDNKNFERVDEKIYIGKHQSIDEDISSSAFYTTSTCAFLSSINVPSDINSVLIFYSLKVVDKQVLFANEEKTVFEVTDPKYTFNDVIINESEIHAILRALTIIKERKTLFEKWQYNKIDPSTKSILCFHGAPGTGKTMCAHAVANYLGKKLLIARYSQIQSKYTGEGEKNLRKYFETAEKQDAVLFIDEADTFLSKRLSSSNSNSKIYNSMSNELFQLIEDFNGCIVFASNLVTDFDPAIISRIIEPIEFKLPDRNTRKKIIKKLLPPALPFEKELTENDFDKLSSISDGFSGRDIRKASLVCSADKLYIEKVINNKKDDEIHFTLEDILVGFDNVLQAKKKLDEAINKTNNKVGEFLKKEEANLRILQISAHALWADGTIDPLERQLFNELSSQFQLKVNIDEISSLPSVRTICQNIKSKSEKIQVLEAACKMVAFDNKYPAEEQKFIKNLLSYLEFDLSMLNIVDAYINQLIDGNNNLRILSNGFQVSSDDILNELRKEYTEAAAYYHLSQMYINGSSLYPTLSKNEEKAKIFLKKSADLGFSKAIKEIENC